MTNATIDYYQHHHPLTRLRSHFALRARQRMFRTFMETLRPEPDAKVLDLGVTPDQLLPESNFFEALYPWKERIVAASIEDAQWLEGRYPGLRFVRIERGPLPFADNEFDILFCSAVIEHVGDTASQRQLVAECLRVSRRFFMTTPNRQFPVDFHTYLPIIHWLPQAWHQRLLQSLGMDFWARTENLNLLTPNGFASLFPKVASLQVLTYTLFGLPSNIILCGEK